MGIHTHAACTQHGRDAQTHAQSLRPVCHGNKPSWVALAQSPPSCPTMSFSKWDNCRVFQLLPLSSVPQTSSTKWPVKRHHASKCHSPLCIVYVCGLYLQLSTQISLLGGAGVWGHELSGKKRSSPKTKFSFQFCLLFNP